MENPIEVIGNTTIYKNKITILAEIREKFKLKDGDKLFWIITKNGDIAIRKKVNKKLTKKERFNVNVSN